MDDYGGVVTHVITYPYMVPVYYNLGKYDLNKLNMDFHKTSTTEQPKSKSVNTSPWDRIDEIPLPSTLKENLHSDFSLLNHKQVVGEEDPQVFQRKSKTNILSNHQIQKGKNKEEHLSRYLNTFFKS